MKKKSVDHRLEDVAKHSFPLSNRMHIGAGKAFFWFLALDILGNHSIDSIREHTTPTTNRAQQQSNNFGGASKKMSVSSLFENGRRPNILIIITDQERKLQHWPESFSKEHLPAMERLKKHGLTFNHHYTNACMCSPSRSTLLTSQFPVKTGVTR